MKRVSIVALLLFASTDVWAADARVMSASQAVLLMQDPDDDVNLSYYARGVMDTAMGNIVYCPSVQTSLEEITAGAKLMARAFVAGGQGEKKFGDVVVAALIRAGCRGR